MCIYTYIYVYMYAYNNKYKIICNYIFQVLMRLKNYITKRPFVIIKISAPQNFYQQSSPRCHYFPATSFTARRCDYLRSNKIFFYK